MKGVVHHRKQTTDPRTSVVLYNWSQSRPQLIGGGTTPGATKVSDRNNRIRD